MLSHPNIGLKLLQRICRIKEANKYSPNSTLG